jgi:hypothetical protein
MIIGWVVLICAIILLLTLAFKPIWRGSQGRVADLEQDYAERLDELDSCLERREEVIELLRVGQKSSAIKLYRDDTGANSKDARAAVERIELVLRYGLEQV